MFQLVWQTTEYGPSLLLTVRHVSPSSSVDFPSLTRYQRVAIPPSTHHLAVRVKHQYPVDYSGICNRVVGRSVVSIAPVCLPASVAALRGVSRVSSLAGVISHN